MTRTFLIRPNGAIGRESVERITGIAALVLAGVPIAAIISAAYLSH